MRPLILADNQDITRAGLFYLYDKIPGLGAVYEAADRKELVGLLTDKPDAVVVLDYTLFDLVGADDLIILQTRFKQVSWILFSEDLSEDFIRRIVYSSDSFGIVLKDASLDEIRASLQFASRGERFICHRITNLLHNRKPEPENSVEHAVLTVTEKEILKAIALGKTTKEIAAERFSSIHTITTHRKNIFRKLEVNNIHEATKYAFRAGIIDAAEYYI